MTHLEEIRARGDEIQNIDLKYPVSTIKNQDAPVWTWRPEAQELKWIHPAEFLRLSRARLQNWRRHDCSHLRTRIREGLPLDPPWLDIEHTTGEIIGHEGRHRAYSALLEGITLIPVIFYHRRGFDYVSLPLGEICPECAEVWREETNRRNGR